MKPTFKHNFKDASGNIDVKGIFGFTIALDEITKHISREAVSNNGSRMIDAVSLLDKVINTNAELMELLKEADTKIEKGENNLHPIFQTIIDSTWKQDLLTPKS